MAGLKNPDHGGRKMENTKDIILYKSLTLFSQKGYEGISMRDIAAAVGIKASSLYNHFKSKEEIFDGIMTQMSVQYEEAAQKIQLPIGDISSVADAYIHITEENLIEIASGLFLYFLKDDFASKFRRMLTMEQFRNEKAGLMFKKYLINGAIAYQGSLFSNMIKRGAFKNCDPHIMALHFYAPIFLLLLEYDNEDEKESEALDILAKHVRQFSALYVK